MKMKPWMWIVLCVLTAVVTYRIGVHILYNYPDNHEIENFPLYTQPDGVTCGPTAIQMVLKYYGKEIDLKDIRKKAKTDIYVKGDIEIGGTAPEYEQEALEYFGVPCKFKVMNVEEIKWNVSHGRPVLVVMRSGIRMWHWEVVIGYTDNEFILADPSGGERWIITSDIFEKSWSFLTDLNGVDCSLPCYICRGKGYIFFALNPLFKCDLCNGIGSIPDWYEILTQWGELRGHMAVVPTIQP